MEARNRRRTVALGICLVVLAGCRHTSSGTTARRNLDGGLDSQEDVNSYWADNIDASSAIDTSPAIDTFGRGGTAEVGAADSRYDATVFSVDAIDNKPIDEAVDGGGAAVMGIVLSIGWGRGTPGRTVSIAGQIATTDASGRFYFDDVPDIYDAIVAEPDGSQVSIYYGLTRRDPVLSHAASYTSALDDPPHVATLSGLLSGSFPFPVGTYHFATIFFLTERSNTTWYLGQPFQSSGPGYGPLPVRWAGDPSVSGNLIALGQIGTEQQHWTTAFLASTSFSIADGAKATRDMSMSSVPIGKIAGSVQMYSGNAVEA